jgi:hypothetical protein
MIIIVILLALKGHLYLVLYAQIVRYNAELVIRRQYALHAN